MIFLKKIFGIHPNNLKSPINRPTKIMRELFKNSGCDLSKWKEIFEPNELLLKGAYIVSSGTQFSFNLRMKLLFVYSNN